LGQQEVTLNQHQAAGAYRAGNSPDESRRDGFRPHGADGGGQYVHTERTYMPPPGQTTRAGEHQRHHTDQRGHEWYESDTVPMLALGIGGGLLAGWLLANVSGPKHRRDEWNQRWPDTRSFDRSDAHWNSRSIATDETRDLIASDKVEGTAVYDRDGERLGSVYNFMVGKRSGQVAYAVMSFGGWLGMGESYHPLPWSTLTYDTGLGGYVVNLTKERLRNAPATRPGRSPRRMRATGNV
jgi:PRC-barrel domain